LVCPSLNKNPNPASHTSYSANYSSRVRKKNRVKQLRTRVQLKREIAKHVAKAQRPVPQAKLSTYRVNWSWPKDMEFFAYSLCRGTVLNFPCGRSRIGLRVDLDRRLRPDVVADLHHPPFRNRSFDTVLCDPPFSMYRTQGWVHNLKRLAKRRLVLSIPLIDIHLGPGWRRSVYVASIHRLFLRMFQVYDNLSEAEELA